MQCFSLRKAERRPANTDRLLASAHQVHFDTLKGRVVERTVGKLGQLKIGAQFTVRTHQHIAVEIFFGMSIPIFTLLVK